MELLDLIAFLIFWETSTCFPSRLLFRRAVMSSSLRPYGLQHIRLPCLSLSPGVWSNSCPLSYDTIQSFHPLLPPSPPVFNLSQHLGLFQWAGSFTVSWLFASDGQSVGALASVLPMNIQYWFPLGLTDLNSWLSKGLLSLLQHHISKALIFWHSAFFIVQLSHLYMTTGKSIALTIQTLAK